MGQSDFAFAISVEEIQGQNNIYRGKLHKPRTAFQINMIIILIISNHCLLESEQK